MWSWGVATFRRAERQCKKREREGELKKFVETRSNWGADRSYRGRLWGTVGWLGGRRFATRKGRGVTTCTTSRKAGGPGGRSRRHATSKIDQADGGNAGA